VSGATVLCDEAMGQRQAGARGLASEKGNEDVNSLVTRSSLKASAVKSISFRAKENA